MTDSASAHIPFDHSITYRDHRLKNLPHRFRLRTVIDVLSKVDIAGRSYLDTGCGNGYISALIANRFHPAAAYGLDREPSNVRQARKLHPAISFVVGSLTDPFVEVPGAPFDVVTCLETLEHVGSLRAAVANLLRLTRCGGVLVVSVPIEVGYVGVLKFGAKMAYGYNLRELPRQRSLAMRYIAALVSGARMSRFRDNRQSWGTHFGFDYRDVDDLLRSAHVQFRVRNSFTTRVYIVSP